MITAQKAANALARFSLILTCLVPTTLIADDMPSAAEIDWVDGTHMEPAARAALPFYCDGGYRQPPLNINVFQI